MAGVQVPISFPTASVGLKEAIDLLRSSKTATDQLRDSSKKLGTETAAAGKQVSSTLEGMNLRLQQLKGQINNTSQANTAQLNKLSAEYKKLQAEIDKTNKKLFEQQTAAKQTGDSWSGMIAAVRASIAVLVVKELSQLALSMSVLRGNIEGVSNAFNKLPNATLLLQQLRRATHGTVDDLKLMQEAIKFQNFRLPLQDLGKYLEFASIRAQQTGMSIDYMMDSIVRGLGRGSIRILDNLQVSVSDINKDMKNLGITVQEAFGKQVDIEMKKLGGFLVTSKTYVEQLTTEWITLKQELAKKADTNWFTKFLTDAVRSMRTFMMSEEEFREFVTSENAVKAAETTIKNLQKEYKDTKALELAIDENIKKRKELLKVRDEELKAEEAKIKQIPGSNRMGGPTGEQIKQQAINESAQKQIEFIKTQKAELRQIIKVLEEYETQTYAVTEAEEEGTKETEEKIIGENKLTQARLNLIAAQKTFDAEFKRSGVTLEEIGFAWDNVTEKAEAYEQAVKNWDIGADLEESMKQLAQLADAWGKTMGVGSYKNIAKDAVIPTNNDIEQDTKETTDFAMGAWQEFFARFRTGWRESGEVVKSEQEQMADVIGQIQQFSFDATQSLLMAEVNAEVDAYDQRIANARDFYDQQIDLAGNNERAKVELQKKRDKELAKLEKQKDEAETRAAKRQVYINAAMAIARAFVDYQYPYSLAVAALAGGAALLQINEINKSPKGYAKGVIGLKGGGTETSDSIPAMLSKNESVMTAQETRDSFKTLHKIRAGKLNDKVLDKILAGGVTVVGSDDSHTAEKLDELIKITKANRPPDYVEKAGILYRVQTKGTNSKRYIRSKYGNFN